MRAVERDGLARAAERLRGARRVFVLTGAGISAESGVPTFRGAQGLWRQFRPEQLATLQAFSADPGLVWEWYAWRRELVGACTPNAGHRALAQIEERLGDGFHLATQNVDGLHAAAGSRRLGEVHGSLWRTRCLTCGVEREDRRLPLPELPPRCPCGGMLRPAIVWFGEGLPEDVFERAARAAQACEVALVVGTSGLVYPAAGLPRLARSAGAFLVEVNPEDTPLTELADVALRGPAAELLPRLLEAAS